MSLIESSHKPVDVPFDYRLKGDGTTSDVRTAHRSPISRGQPPEAIAERERTAAERQRKRVADLPLAFVVYVIWALHRLWLLLPPRAGSRPERSRSAAAPNRPRR